MTDIAIKEAEKPAVSNGLEPSAMRSSPLDLFFDEEVQKLIDSFAYCFKVKISIFSPKMEELISGIRNPNSCFCNLVQKKLQLRYRCSQQEKIMCERCVKQNRAIVYDCFSGLSEIVMPIKIDEKCVGYGLMGQFRRGNELPDDIMQLWKNEGNSLKELTDAFNSQPFMDKAMLDNSIRLFSMMISFIVTREYVRIRKPGLSEQVIHWIDEHIGDPFTLDDVADALNCSRSTISHTVRRQLGINFKKICILKKIQRFESLTAFDPQLSIKEAAAMVGYDDPLLFSRIYKKIRLASPSVYMNSVRRKKNSKLLIESAVIF